MSDGFDIQTGILHAESSCSKPKGFNSVYTLPRWSRDGGATQIPLLQAPSVHTFMCPLRGWGCVGRFTILQGLGTQATVTLGLAVLLKGWFYLVSPLFLGLSSPSWLYKAATHGCDCELPIVMSFLLLFSQFWGPGAKDKFANVTKRLLFA